MSEEDKACLRARLREEAVANADRDLAMAAEWFALEEEAFQIAEQSSQECLGHVTHRPGGRGR